MMDASSIISYASLTIGAAALVCGIRMHMATARTTKDRTRALDACIKHGRVLNFRDDNNIPFMEHWAAVVLFRNPWKMYSVKYLNFLHANNVMTYQQYNEAFMHARARETQALDILSMAIDDVDKMRNTPNPYAGRGSDTHHAQHKSE